MSTKSKRTLYKPVPNKPIVTKSQRKPLAQGRLITDSSSNDITKKKTSYLTQGKQESKEQAVTPRKNVSRYGEQRSSQPSPTLDLSDLDVEIVDSEANQSVIVVDASENTLNPDRTEVSLSVGLKKSPVRVICHVDNHLVSERDDEPVDIRKYKTSTSQVISPLIKDMPRSASKQKCTPLKKQVLTPQNSKGNYPQPNFNDSQENDTVDDDVQSLTSDIDVCSLDEYLCVIKDKTKPEKTSSKNTSLRHKTVSSIIPSRYMQSATKTTSSFTNQKNSSSRNARGAASNKSLSSRSDSQSHAAHHHPHAAHHHKKPSTPILSNQQSSRAVTPNISSQPGGGGGKTSTPCLGEALPNTTHDIDASAIQAEISAISADLSTATLSQMRKIKVSSINKKNRPKKQDIKMCQQRLDVLYARYLQWLYLHTRAKNSFKVQEKAAMSQLTSLWEEVERLRERDAALKLQLIKLKHLNILDDDIELQKCGLGSVINNLPILDRDYHKLAESLDTTRHQISTKGIYIPDDEDTYQESLESALKESEYLLGDISVLIRPEIPKTYQFSNSLQTTHKLVGSECSELIKCTELLSASKSLAIQESSLKIQAIQSQGEAK